MLFPVAIICSPKHSDSLAAEWLAPRMQLLVEKVHELVISGALPALGSVAGATPFVHAFTAAYATLSDISPVDGPPVLDIIHSHCPRSRWSADAPALPEGHEIRLVQPGDTTAVSHLAKLLAQFRNVPIVGAAYDRCTGCSERVVKAYEEQGFDMLLRAFNETEFLPELTGLKALYEETQAALENDDLVDAEEDDF